jgi:PAS domain S-box-containing protein
LVYLVCEANDISDRKEAEEKLRSAHDQLEQRVRERTMELEKTNEKLKAQIMEKRRVEQALLESEKRLQNRVEYLNTLLSNLNEIFFVYGKDGNITFLNNKACEVLGYEPGEMIGRHASLLVPYPNRKRVCEEINRRIELGTANSYEVPLRCKDGSERLARINSSPIVENGEITGGMALGEDITGYRQTEEALRISEKKFSTAFRLSPDMLSIISATGKYMEVNDSWLEHTGYSRDEVIGQNPVEMGIWFDMTNIRSIARELLDSGIAMNMEASFKTKSGEVRKVLTSLAQISFNDEYYTIVQSHDITERKMMQDDLAREKERLQATLKSIGDGVIATDHRGRIIVVNEAAESILGIEHNEMIGQQLENVMNELIIDSPDEETTQVSRAMPLNLSIHTAHGEERLIEASLAPMSSREGDYTGVVWAIRDVTDRQRMEEEILKSSKLESLGVLAGGIAHDFNNLLTVVVGNLALSKMVLEENDEVIEYLTEAEKASFQAKGLTQQLLTFARGGAPIKKTRQLHSLIHDSVNLALSGSNVLGEFIIQDDLWPVDIDEGQMHQVINNLVINAVQAMPGGGKINIRACNINLSPDEIPPLPAGRYICIAVQDFGAGIPDELRSRIFDPYFTTKTMGSGLGLATSYSIIRKHDGHITVHSEPGRGSTFYVYLPASMRVIESNADGAGAIIPGRGRILLLDDDERIRDVAGQILDSIGYSAGLAKNGREVLEMYQQAMNRGEKYDMVIIDLTIPGEMGGKETARDLLRLDPEVKMVVSSGYSNDPVMAQYQEWGFQGVIAKPYGIKELSEVISSILNN